MLTPTTSLTHDGKTAKTAKQRANMLAKYYARRYEPSGAPPRTGPAPSPPNTPPPVTVHEVMDALRGMKDTAPGRDGVPRAAWWNLTSCHHTLAAVFSYLLPVALFDMQNSNRFNILLISIF